MDHKILLLVFGAGLLLLANEADCKIDGGEGSRVKREAGGVKEQLKPNQDLNTTEHGTPITSPTGNKLTPDEIFAYDFARRENEYRAMVTAEFRESQKNNSSSSPGKYDSGGGSK